MKVGGDDDTKIYAGWIMCQALLFRLLPYDNPQESLLPALKEASFWSHRFTGVEN